MNEIHRKALEVAQRFRRAEADLIAILQEVESARVFFNLGYTSLFNYCVQALGLSESVAANFIAAARKARETPVLQTAISNGTLSVSKARKITPVLNLSNQDEWIERAKTWSTRMLEEEVARVVPREAVPERLKPVGPERIELRLGISKTAEGKLKRVQDLESQRTSRAVSLEETLDTLLAVYLESKDPLKRAERVLRSADSRARSNDVPAPVTGHVIGPIPAKNFHQVRLRDGGRCTHSDSSGERCPNRRWIDIHHVRPRNTGGTNELSTEIFEPDYNVLCGKLSIRPACVTVT